MRMTKRCRRSFTTLRPSPARCASCIDDWWQPAKSAPELKGDEGSGQHARPQMRKFARRPTARSVCGAWGLVLVDSMSDLVTRLRAEDVNEPIERLLDEAADRIANLELALVELSRTDGSPRNVASTELLASRVRMTARRALGGSAPRRPQPTPDKINEAFRRATRC